MKPEARILVSSCVKGICSGFVLRGKGVDGVVVGTNCTSLCIRLSERGFLGELRYAIGDCNCGLPRPSEITEIVRSYLDFSELSSMRIRDFLERLQQINP